MNLAVEVEMKRPRKRGTLVVTECGICGVPFQTLAYLKKRGRGRYCSHRCLTQHMRSCRPPRTADDERYFWVFVDRSGGEDACWPWLSSVDKDGYGKLMRGRRQTRAHRYALTIAEGPAPAGKPLACHSCDNPPCCNARHLRWASPQENMDDKVRRGRCNGNRKLGAPERVGPPPITPSEIVVRDLWLDGFTPTEIGALLGRSMQSISHSAGRIRAKGYPLPIIKGGQKPPERAERERASRRSASAGHGLRVVPDEAGAADLPDRRDA